ncbi:MAG: pilin [Candidatus Saccharibacteria bacterium]|nr:pilin [Candidatus Saccharibacteria bacterium]
MKSTISKIITLAVVALFGIVAFNSNSVFADSICDNPGVSAEVKAASGCGSGTSEQLPSVVQNILYVVIGISSIIAVIFIIIGGVNYMTSSGDAGKVKKAKDTILYAVIGLIVCALAFAIVNFAVGTILGQK